ncbi:MAG: adenylosuccinate synthase [Deltaproteobacteria bacterium]|jgi:adenylosuccinate synthase|nr:adenylosuccinate synthase [Deltaproteobacteria bacterium]
MAVVVVVGAQWGDEGKGKVVDHYAENADLVVRFGGGANAGHTLVVDGQKLVTHLIPSGVLHPGKVCVLGDGMVIDPQTLLEEIDDCRSRGLLGEGSLLVSEGAHVILPYHRQIEALREAGAHAVGTTRRGIGPCYEAKAGRRGVRVRDLLERRRLAAAIDRNLEELAALLAHHGQESPSKSELDDMISRGLAAGERLAEVIGDGGPFVAGAIADGKNVLLEGAQGALLDVDHGTYPYVTSSSTLAAGACQGVGIGPTAIDRVVAISKAYCTRVGDGPFPSEMNAEEAESWREAGGEFGATTGRPRRCGWLDIPALRRAVRINGADTLALTKVDILAGRGPIKVCVGYRDGDEVLSELPGDRVRVERLQPIYETMEGWEPHPEARTMDELPAAARTYIDEVCRRTEIELGMVSVGASRRATMVLSDPFSG